MLQNLLPIMGAAGLSNTAQKANEYGTDADNSFDPLGFGGALSGAALGGLGGYFGGRMLSNKASNRISDASEKDAKTLSSYLRNGNISDSEFLKLDKSKQLEYIRKHHINTKKLAELETRTKITKPVNAVTGNYGVLGKPVSQTYKAATGNTINKNSLDKRGASLIDLMKNPPTQIQEETKGISGLLGKAKSAKGGMLARAAENPRLMSGGGAVLGAMLGSQILGNALTQDRHAQTASQMQAYAQQDAFNQQKDLMTLQQPYQVRF